MRIGYPDRQQTATDLPDEKKKEAVKENILKILKEKYDIRRRGFSFCGA